MLIPTLYIGRQICKVLIIRYVNRATHYPCCIHNTTQSMKREENYKYNTAIAEIANWGYSSYVRTHYNIKPHKADKMVQNLLKYTDLIQGVYFTLEDDSTIYGGGTNDSFVRNINRSVNHMHLLFALDKNTDITRIRRSVKRRVKDGDIIRTVSQIVTGEQALRETIVQGLDVNQKALGKIEPIRNNTEIVKYINKHMSNPQAHHNYFFNSN